MACDCSPQQGPAAGSSTPRTCTRLWARLRMTTGGPSFRTQHAGPEPTGNACPVRAWRVVKHLVSLAGSKLKQGLLHKLCGCVAEVQRGQNRVQQACDMHQGPLRSPGVICARNLAFPGPAAIEAGPQSPNSQKRGGRLSWALLMRTRAHHHH